MYNMPVPQNFYAFRAKYCYDRNARMPKACYFPDWVVKPGSDNELAALCDAVSHRVTKAEALTLPPLVRQQFYVSLTPAQAKHYKSLEKDFLTYCQDESCVTTTAITKLLRLQQVCAGLLPLTSNDTLQHIGTEKLAVLRDLLSDLTPHHKVIVWTHWKPTYEEIARICEELGCGFTSLTGETPMREREEHIKAFNEDAGVRVLIGNQGAGGIGVNLQAASYMIYYSKTYNLEHDIQSEARAHRAGSEIHQKITRIDLVTKDTIEEVIEEALCKKMKSGELIMKFRRANLPSLKD
jgi:SNF2 family DNA or RNA helicase